MELLSEMIEQSYKEVNQLLGLWPEFNQASMGYCHLLTSQLLEIGRQADLSLSRELHIDSTNPNLWHYQIAHRPPHLKPAYDDLITDLNPYHFKHYGGTYLHLNRQDLMAKLKSEGASAGVVALRALSTLELGHDESVLPRHIRPRLV